MWILKKIDYIFHYKLATIKEKIINYLIMKYLKLFIVQKK